MLVGAVLLGVFLHDKAALDVPVIKGFVRKDNHYSFASVLLYGIAGGLVSGILLTWTAVWYRPVLPLEFLQLATAFQPTLPVRFLYGGITEEILMRFGLMTFTVWLLLKAFKTVHARIYWFGIVATALMFALGHLPVAFIAVGNPSALLISYILVGNSIGGIVFGWLYWKKGLEAAFIAHLFTHIILLAGESWMGSWA